MSESTTKVEGRHRPAWKTLLLGFTLGILASLLALIAVAFRYGPRGYSATLDLYTGDTITYRHFLWKRSHVSEPKPPHVQWAIQHQDAERSWYLPCDSMTRGWFQKGLAVSFSTREYVHDIYSLQIPEAEKIDLLHQYHSDLDVLRLKEQEWTRSGDFMEAFYQDWKQRLESMAIREAST